MKMRIFLKSNEFSPVFNINYNNLCRHFLKFQYSIKINRSNIKAQTFLTIFIFIIQIHNIYAFNIKTFYPIELILQSCVFSMTSYVITRKVEFAKENTSKKAFNFISSFYYILFHLF